MQIYKYEILFEQLLCRYSGDGAKLVVQVSHTDVSTADATDFMLRLYLPYFVLANATVPLWGPQPTIVPGDYISLYVRFVNEIDYCSRIHYTIHSQLCPTFVPSYRVSL